MKAVCKMTGKEVVLPCSYAGCSLFGDCLVAYEKATAKPMTNADHIRSMTDEELADFMSAFCEMSDDCKKCPLFGGCPESDQACWWEEWLKQPYKEDA